MQLHTFLLSMKSYCMSVIKFFIDFVSSNIQSINIQHNTIVFISSRVKGNLFFTSIDIFVLLVEELIALFCIKKFGKLPYSSK